MGVLTDYFRATDAGAVARTMGEGDSGPLELEGAPFDGFADKGLDPAVRLGVLVAVVRGVEWRPDLVGSRPVWPAVPEEADSWVFELDAGVRDVLAAVPDAAVAGLAAEVVLTEDWAGTPVEDVRATLEDLIALSRRARDAGDLLYCWCTV
ncbi:hypothetical protein AB0I60_21455 [Actinosynnema sp. NPDC050436]|uniref:hypothetical protein n=1 Tax=Actinosynnema sp. NPDC050436 TaxID=3155659 RepID=UPI0033D92EE1